MRKGVYVVFVGSKSTRATHHKRAAIKFAKQHPGAQVRGISRSHWREGGAYGWDAPTFRTCSELVYANQSAAGFDGGDGIQ